MCVEHENYIVVEKTGGRHQPDVNPRRPPTEVESQVPGEDPALCVASGQWQTRARIETHHVSLILNVDVQNDEALRGVDDQPGGKPEPGNRRDGIHLRGDDAPEVLLPSLYLIVGVQVDI